MPKPYVRMPMLAPVAFLRDGCAMRKETEQKPRGGLKICGGHCPPLPAAFTLVELLVVIGIIEIGRAHV